MAEQQRADFYGVAAKALQDAVTVLGQAMADLPVGDTRDALRRVLLATHTAAEASAAASRAHMAERLAIVDRRVAEAKARVASAKTNLAAARTKGAARPVAAPRPQPNDQSFLDQLRRDVAAQKGRDV